jgi:hypothetical protein
MMSIWTGKDLLAFRRMLKAERKAGVPVAEIAKKHGVAHIYQIWLMADTRHRHTQETAKNRLPCLFAGSSIWRRT